MVRRLASTTSTPPASRTVVGVDLGTTNSAVAVMRGRTPQIIENEEGSRTTPSIVAFDKETGNRFVGAPAKRQAVVNTENTLYATKRLMGRRFDDPETQYDIDKVGYKIVEAKNGDAWVEVLGKQYSPAQIGGFVLEKMKSIAEQSLGETINRAVVTVPAYFNDAQRQATKNAGRIVGLEVLRVVNEPTAAALAYGLDREKEGVVAVFDLGGGTFDISILDIEDRVFEVRSTNGDTHLGGEDFDALLVNYILDHFHKQTGIDLTGDRERVQRIREAAERAKIELSHVKETTISLPFIYESHHISLKLTEDELDSMSAHLIQRTVDPVKRALKDAELEDPVDEVILVGGMTRMPKIRTTVAELFGKKPSTAVNPDEAVALGAAIQAGVLSGAVKNVLLLDVTPLTLGIETYGGVFSPLITRNTAVPVKKTEVFSTGVDNQTGVEIRVFQGERGLVRDNKLIGHLKLSGIPPMPKGAAQVEVSFDIDADGIINVSAREKVSGQETSITVVQGSTGLSEEAIQKMVEEGEQYKEFDNQKRQLAQMATNFDLLVRDTERGIIAFEEAIKQDEEFDAMLNEITEGKRIIKEARENPETQLTVADIRKLSQDLQELSMRVFQRVAKKQQAEKLG
ncbi:Heat shock protein SSC1, mitochondrial [Cyberlindnera fabianii]|uniref:Heat shock protein SSC1, mitochondrial n=1 Tax=Cyberlindnera fabianii TaxID=36022 RepID=A0A1V2L855_CYBFA|nr:Heat shock protein SSC1, mitochondrial [Cyberlindnera fabianii]